MDAAVETETKGITIKVNVRILDEWIGSCSDYAVIELGQAQIARIKLLQSAVKELKVAHITEYDYAPEFHMAQDRRMDYVKLVVSDDSFWWTGTVKHNDVDFETKEITFDLLESPEGTVHDLREYLTDEEEEGAEEEAEEGGQE